MKYRLLGRSGLRVSELCLGTMTFGEDWGWGASRDESRKIFDAFAEAGGNFVDTANRYTNGTSEKLVGEFAASDRERFVIATKYTLFTRRDHPNAGGSHRKNLVASLEASLKRLRTDYVDLYWVHAWDFLTPVDEVMRGLDDLVRAGKVLYVGVSDTPAWVVARANTLAELRGWTAFVGLQIEYSLAQRDAERELLPMARALDLAVTAWSPLAGGVLTGKYQAPPERGTEPARYASGKTARLSERNRAIAAEVTRVAAEVGRSPAQVAIAWVRQQQHRAVVIPILGARRLEQIRDNLACLELELDAAQLRRLDEASRIVLGFPHDFLAGDNVRDLVYGGFYPAIESHRR
jgi:aryl-alcohol dehydrogenase-like predicted oxidoreductase